MNESDLMKKFRTTLGRLNLGKFPCHKEMSLNRTPSEGNKISLMPTGPFSLKSLTWGD